MRDRREVFVCETRNKLVLEFLSSLHIDKQGMNVWCGCRKYQHKYQGLSHAFTCLHHSEDISIKDLSVARCPSVVCRWSGEPCLLLLLLPRSNVSPHFTFTICLCHPSVCPAERWIQNYILHKHYTLSCRPEILSACKIWSIWIFPILMLKVSPIKWYIFSK